MDVVRSANQGFEFTTNDEPMTAISSSWQVPSKRTTAPSGGFFSSVRLRRSMRASLCFVKR